MPRVYTFRPLNSEVLRWHPELREGEREQDYFELIWNDIHLDEDYQVGLGFFHRPPSGYDRVDVWKKDWDKHPEKKNWSAVELHITDPQGKVHTGTGSYPLDTVKPEPFGVTMGPHTFAGKLNAKGLPESYQMKVNMGDVGVDLACQVIAGGVRFVEDEHGYSYYHPIRKRALGWWPLVVRAEVKGNLTVEGKPVKVSGLAYAERQLGNLPSAGPNAFATHFWGHLFAGDYSAVWVDDGSAEHFNYRHFSPFVLWKGSEVVLSTHHFTCYAEQFGLDPDGIPYPIVESLKASDGVREFTAQLVHGVLVNRMGIYHRQYSDVYMQIRHWGVTEEAHGKSVHEWSCGSKWFPQVFEKAFGVISV